MLELDVTIITSHTLCSLTPYGVQAACTYTGRPRFIPAAGVLLVTSREPEQGLFDALQAEPRGVQQVIQIGDCLAPGTIAAAVYSGHRFAREFDAPPGLLRMRRELVALEDWPAP